MKVIWYIYNVEGSYFPFTESFKTRYEAELALKDFFDDNIDFYNKYKEDYIFIPRIVED